MNQQTWEIRPVTDRDRPAIRKWMEALWGDARVVVHDTVYLPEQLEGFVADMAGEWLGLITFRIAEDQCEVVTLDAIREGDGIGSALMAAVRRQAEQTECRRVWLITTNDNLHALGFCQKRGYRLVGLAPGAVNRSRKIKPQIPEIGMNNIPIRDEMELELRLDE